MERFDPRVAEVLRPVLPELAAETLRAISAEVPDYSRALEGPFGVTLRDGVERALGRFVDSIEHPAGIDERDRRLYVELGRGEMRQGRTLNALLAAYRVGAQVAWRHFVAAGVRGGLEPDTLYRLGEAIFAYIDALSGESIEGYAAEQSAHAGQRQRLRVRLVALLAADPPPTPEVLRAAADRAGWPLPGRIAALAVQGADPERLIARLGPAAVAATLDSADGTPVAEDEGSEPRDVLAFIPDPPLPRLRAQVQRAVGSRPAALGPAVALADAGRSADRARRALELAVAGALGADGLVVAEDHAGALLMHADPALAAEVVAARLAPLESLRPAVRARLHETLRAWLDRQGRIDETARALGVHPQTVRYRLNQLREVFGAALDDPGARFELELALRVERAAP